MRSWRTSLTTRRASVARSIASRGDRLAIRLRALASVSSEGTETLSAGSLSPCLTRHSPERGCCLASGSLPLGQLVDVLAGCRGRVVPNHASPRAREASDTLDVCARARQLIVQAPIHLPGPAANGAAMRAAMGHVLHALLRAEPPNSAHAVSAIQRASASFSRDAGQSPGHIAPAASSIAALSAFPLPVALRFTVATGIP